MPSSLFRLLCIPLFVIPLGGCASGSIAISKSINLLFSDNSAEIQNATLDPGKRYLYVTVNGRTALMVLGYLQADPHGAIEIWYSAKGEVIQIQQGRIVKTAGLSTDWRAVRYPAGVPAWDASLKGPREYVRERDEMPGYRFNIRESLLLTAIATPADSLLHGMPAEQLRWYAESSLPQATTPALPPSRYALHAEGNSSSVMYAEQCLTPQLCLSWQRWPVDSAPKAD